MTKLNLKILPGDEVINDGDKPVAEVVKLLNDRGVMLKYGEIAIAVLKSDLERAKIQALLVPEHERPRLMCQIDRSLRRLAKKFTATPPSKKVCDHFYVDLMLWHCLKETCAS
jgi:hypothetical protein